MATPKTASMLTSLDILNKEMERLQGKAKRQAETAQMTLDQANAIGQAIEALQAVK